MYMGVKHTRWRRWKCLLISASDHGRRRRAACLRPAEPDLVARARRRAQDLFESRVISMDTDFRMFSAGHLGALPGIDLATVLDGAAYHTCADVPERLRPGSLQARRRAPARGAGRQGRLPYACSWIGGATVGEERPRAGQVVWAPARLRRRRERGPAWRAPRDGVAERLPYPIAVVEQICVSKTTEP